MTISIKGLKANPYDCASMAIRFREAIKREPNGVLFKVHSPCRAYLFLKTGSNTLFEMSDHAMYKVRNLQGTMQLHSNDRRKKMIDIRDFSVQKATLTLED